jgi:hypothetical protein
MDKTYLKNFAGVEGCDNAIIAELKFADIDHTKFSAPFSGEVPTRVMGEIHGSGWGFMRAWTYWVCEGPGIPLEDATALHVLHGQVVRVAGHCGCPSPLEWYKGFGCGLYHVDTLEGLKALSYAIKKIMERNK